MLATELELRPDEEMASSGPEIAGGRRAERFASMCSGVVVALMALASVLGLWVHDLYQEDRWAIAAFRGNDLVTLVLVAPLLAIAIIRSKRSSRWTLVWLGGLLYSVYNFAYYAFGTTFNDVFLVHVAALALSIGALVALAAHLDVDALCFGVGARRSDRVTAVYMVLVGTALVAAWGGLSLRFAVSGELPADVMPPTAVHLVYALDMSLLAPAFITGGLLLWQRRPWGYALGAAVNLFGAAYLIVLEFAGGFQADAGIAGKTWNSPPTIIGALLCAAAATTLLRRIPSLAPTSISYGIDLRPSDRPQGAVDAGNEHLHRRAAGLRMSGPLVGPADDPFTRGALRAARPTTAATTSLTVTPPGASR